MLVGKHISRISKALSHYFEVEFESLIMLNVIPLCLLSLKKGRIKGGDRCPTKLNTLWKVL